MNISIPTIKLKLPAFLKRARKETTASTAAAAPASAAGLKWSAFADRPLPFIGRWPVAKQFKTLIAMVLIFPTLATIVVFVDIRKAAQTAVYVSTATEMQMLSQRIANAAQQAVRGTPLAFTQLQQSRDRFIGNLELLSKGGEKLGVSVPPSSSKAQPALQEIEKLWKPVQTNINLILSQRQNLLELRELETTIEKTSPQLSMLAQELVVSAVDNHEAQRTITYARQLSADVGNFDFINALRLLSTDNPDAQVALQLGSNTRTFQRTLNALLGEARDATITPIQSEATKAMAEKLNKTFAPFATSTQAIVANMQSLARTKQSSRNIFAASELLLKAPGDLTDIYQSEASAHVFYVAAAMLFGAAGLLSLILLGKVFLDDARRRALHSEAENRRNQEAILRLLDEMGQVADGDLTVQARVTEDITGAIADSVNYTIEELRRLVAGITRASAQVSRATAEAQRITAQLLDATQNQATQIGSTGQSVVAMARSINEVSENAARSAEVAQQSLAAAEKGANAVQKAVRGMNDIREQIQETSKRIKRLGESSQEIGEIVQLITEITEQTNVLALNAAIQAASAGEAGRGFTVVAEEVQRLAERSAEATKHISSIVKTIQRDTQDTVEAMEHSTQGVVEGTRIADEAGQALHEIEDVSKRLAALIASISAATHAQAQSAKEVEANMQSILGVTKLTTDSTKKTAASAAELDALANELKSSVTRFKLA
ncbi:MAG: methyl-accepting chemotaxis protein [Methanocella sp.]